MSLSEEEPKAPRATYQLIIVLSAMIFLALPFVSSFNEFLTSLVMSFRLYTFIHNVVVPIEVRMIGAILQYFFGIQTSVSTTSLYLQGPGRSLSVVIAWNCVGWQSLVLFGFTLLTGLQGPYTRRSKALCVALGAEGIFLLNLLRIVLVILLAFYFGYLPAVVFHDYAGTILTLIYLVLFWLFSFKYVLERVGFKEEQQVSQGEVEQGSGTNGDPSGLYEPASQN